MEWVSNQYWYARGYFDGRTNGEDICPENITDSEVLSYKRGFETGVADWCDLDEPRQEYEIIKKICS